MQNWPSKNWSSQAGTPEKDDNDFYPLTEAQQSSLKSAIQRAPKFTFDGGDWHVLSLTGSAREYYESFFPHPPKPKEFS